MSEVKLNFPEKQSFVGNVIAIDEKTYQSKSKNEEATFSIIYVTKDDGGAAEFAASSVLVEDVEVGDKIFATVEDRKDGYTHYIDNGVPKKHENTGLSAVNVRVL